METYWEDCVKNYDFATARTAENEIFSIEGVASGSLYNYGNSCMVDAMQRAWDALKDTVTGEETEEAEEDFLVHGASSTRR
ncbi:MAG: hypothetical protein GY764_06160 [Halieaceae bacterium]|nr:hypothetical protein [Halieaceae bacterium]